eukprot:gene10049-12318_t
MDTIQEEETTTFSTATNTKTLLDQLLSQNKFLEEKIDILHHRIDKQDRLIQELLSIVKKDSTFQNSSANSTTSNIGTSTIDDQLNHIINGSSTIVLNTSTSSTTTTTTTTPTTASITPPQITFTNNNTSQTTPATTTTIVASPTINDSQEIKDKSTQPQNISPDTNHNNLSNSTSNLQQSSSPLSNSASNLSNPNPNPNSNSPTQQWSRPKQPLLYRGFSTSMLLKKENSKDEIFYYPPSSPKPSRSPNVQPIYSTPTTPSPRHSSEYTDSIPILPEGSQWAVAWEYNAADDEWTRGMIAVEIESKPFASGALRNAYKLHIRMNPSNLYKHFESPIHQKYEEGKKVNASKLPSLFGPVDTVYVAKESKSSDVKFDRYFEDVKMQMQCKEYGIRYNDYHPPKKIEFLSAWVIEIQKGANNILYGMELFMKGEFKKQNSNYGSVFSDRNTPQAFSHFTYECSHTELIVVDIQGVDDIYTDPQIHTKDGKGYGAGNLGSKGIERFLKSHKCNPICIQYGLPPIGVILNDVRSTSRVLRGTMLLPDLIPDLVFPIYPKLETPQNPSNSELVCGGQLSGHDERITSLIIRGNRMFSASADGYVKIWDLDKLQLLDSFRGHRRSIDSMCINDTYLFTASSDQSIKVWNYNQQPTSSSSSSSTIRDCIFKLEDHSGEVNCITIDMEKNYLFSCSFDKSIKVWDLTTMKCIKTLNGHTKSVKSIFVSGKYLFSASNDMSIKVWDLDMMMCIYGMSDAHDGWITSLQLYKNALYSGARDGTLKDWNLSTFVNNTTIDKNNDGITDLLITDDGYLFMSSEDSTLKICDTSTMKILYSLKAHRSGIQAIGIYGNKLFSGGCDNLIKWWNWKDK